MNEAQRGDFLNFEGNAQGFRVLTQLEYHQFDGGTRLTYATLGAYLKYPWDGPSRGCTGLQEAQVRLLPERIATAGTDRQQAGADTAGAPALGADTRWCT